MQPIRIQYICIMNYSVRGLAAPNADQGKHEIVFDLL